MCKLRYRTPVIVMLLAVVGSVRGQGQDVPPEKIPGQKPGTMMTAYWLRQADQAFERWKKEYEALKTPEQIAAYQKRLREKFIEAIGGLPERTPLNPQVVGKVQRDGYRVEKIIFESQPQHFVTALLFLPEGAAFKPPHPGVLVPCGHSKNAKGYESYQSVGALLALNGMAALVFDPIDQGERGQSLGDDGWPKVWGTSAHSRLNISSTLLGRSTAHFEIWDGMRAIDYLASRPEVDPARIGCTGNSGGGTQTSYLMALDDRIKAAAPSCYLCGFPALLKTIGPQDAEQNIFGQLAFGMDHADYLLMRAPTPILICAATQDFFDIGGAWDVFRYAKRLYTRQGFAERVSLLENDEKHNYNKLQREGAVRWLSRWLLHVDQAIVEPTIKQLSESETQCAPDGQVMQLTGARSVFDLNRDCEKQLAAHRTELWKTGDRGELLAQVRKIAGIRKLAELPKPEVERIGSAGLFGGSKKVQVSGSFGPEGSSKREVEEVGPFNVTHLGRIERLLLKPEDGIVLPALLWVPKSPQPNRGLLLLHEDGKRGYPDPGEFVKQGATVLSVDLPGTGQTKSSAETKDVFMAYLLGRSYVGLRAESILLCARYLRESRNDEDGVDLVAAGHVGIPALHAAAVESGLFQSVKLVRTLNSWSSVIDRPLTKTPQSQVVHGALRTYDLPDLASTLGAKLTVEGTP